MATTPTSLNQLLARIEEILQMLKEGQGPSEPSSEVSLQLQRLAQQMKALTNNQITVLKEANIDPNTAIQEIIDSPQADPSIKEWLEKTKKMERDIQQFREAISKAMKATKNRRKEHTSNTKQQIQERRKLFKTLGGDEKWRPL